MRRTLTAAFLIVALGGGWAGAAAARAQLPATPKLPSFGKGLFAPRPAEDTSPGQTTSRKDAAGEALPATPTFLRSPAGTREGREATLQALQDCYARGAPRVIGTGAAATRIRRLRQLCENEEIADTRAWLKWSKLGDNRQSRRIVDAIQQDDAEKALAGAAVAPAA